MRKMNVAGTKVKCSYLKSASFIRNNQPKINYCIVDTFDTSPSDLRSKINAIIFDCITNERVTKKLNLHQMQQLYNYGFKCLIELWLLSFNKVYILYKLRFCVCVPFSLYKKKNRFFYLILQKRRRSKKIEDQQKAN